MKWYVVWRDLSTLEVRVAEFESHEAMHDFAKSLKDYGNALIKIFST